MKKMKWKVIHLLLDTYRLSSSSLLVLMARISLREDFFVLTLLLPGLKILIKAITMSESCKTEKLVLGSSWAGYLR